MASTAKGLTVIPPPRDHPLAQEWRARYVLGLTPLGAPLPADLAAHPDAPRRKAA